MPRPGRLLIIPYHTSLFQDPDDLPFRKGEILTVVSKDEEQWWTARNNLGQTGSIPVPYVVKVRLQLNSVSCVFLSPWNQLDFLKLNTTIQSMTDATLSQHKFWPAMKKGSSRWFQLYLTALKCVWIKHLLTADCDALLDSIALQLPFCNPSQPSKNDTLG